MNILAAHKYPSQRNGPLSLQQEETRRLAYAIKSTASASADFDTAGRDMAALITGPCRLVPVPDSTGSTDANSMLAHAIARYVASAAGTTGAQIARAITRTQPIPSQCQRHKHALSPIPPEAHHIARTRKTLTLRQTYFVDNVTTSGHTLDHGSRSERPLWGTQLVAALGRQPARAALGFGAGLVFADAASHRTQIQATLI